MFDHFVGLALKGLRPYGRLSIKLFSPQIWQVNPQNIRQCKTYELKTKIKSWYVST